MKPQDPKRVALALSPRWDLAVKALFFRHLLGLHAPDAERLYRWHIEKRTRGVERGSDKATVEDYVKGCVDLLLSMQKHGFLPEYPIVVTKTGSLKAGAHRLACALVLEQSVFVNVIDAPDTQPWARDWFIKHQSSEHDVTFVEETWRALVA